MRRDALLGRKVAGRFTITRFLGEGGMASVYVAERDVEPRRVAIKIMSSELMADASFIRRFQREAKAAARIKHPSSVKIYEYGIEGALSYIVMELIQGDDLYALLERGGALTQRRAVRILADVCDALMAAHEMGVVHRDLKPENIMVTADPTHPAGERVKVLDFGIAKILDAGEPGDGGPGAGDAMSAVTRAGTFVGTPAYMSPEQCGLLPVDTRADIYTCGVLLYQLVTGRVPFEGETPLHTATLHIHAPVPAPSAIAPAIDPRLDALIVKALAKKPADRHQTARHLGASLRKLLVDLPDVVVGVGPISRRQTSSAVSREALLDGAEGSDESIESARTLTAENEVGAPQPVMLRSSPTSEPATQLLDIAAVKRGGRSPAGDVVHGAPLRIPESARDAEESTLTLVRPGDGPQAEPETPRAGPVREVKSTLRSAKEFGLRAPGRPVEVALVGLDAATPAPASGPGAPWGGAPPASAAAPPPPAPPAAAEPIPQRVLQTVRMASPASAVSNPLPPSQAVQPDAPTLLAPPAAQPSTAGFPVLSASTVPMPRSVPSADVNPLAPTEVELPQVPVPDEQGWLSGRRGMLVGFLAGMVITAVLVLLYLSLR